MLISTVNANIEKNDETSNFAILELGKTRYLAIESSKKGYTCPN